MSNLSFTSQGATPGGMSYAMNTPFNTPGSSTPAAMALNNAVANKPLQSTPAPSTPVKKTTVTNTDGSSTSTEYHAPQTDSTTSASTATNPTPSTPQQDPTYNPYTGSTASTPTYGTNTPVVTNSNGQAIQPNTTPATTFPGLLGGLTEASAQGSQTAPGYISSTANYGAGNIPIGQQAENIASQAQQQEQAVGQKAAGFEGGQLTTGTSPVAEGNAAVTANLAAQEQTAIAQAAQTGLLGTQQALTAQNQAAGATNEAAGQAQTGQGLVQSGLTSAATLAQPSTVTPGQAVFNPATGTYTSTNSTNPASAPSGYDQGVWGQYINDLSTGNVGAIPTSVTGNSAIFGQLQEAVQAQNPGFSYNTAVGQGQGQQAVGAAGGTAAAGNITTSAEAAGTVSAAQTQQIAQYQSAQQQGQNLISQASNLISTFGLNPSQLNVANGAIQKIAQNTSSPQYQELSNYLNDIASRYSQILTPPGGTATDSTRAIAAGMLNATAQGTSLQAVMNSLDQQADAVIAGVRTSTPTSTATNTGTIAPSTAGGGWASLGD